MGVLLVKTLLLLVLLGGIARADESFCALQLGNGIIPQTGHQRVQCHGMSYRVFRALHRLCKRFPGTNICVRFLEDDQFAVEANACGPPAATIEECCAAHCRLFIPGTSCGSPATPANPLPSPSTCLLP